MQRVLGYDRYLMLFSIFKIKTLVYDKRKADFLFFETMLSKEANVIVIGACTGITTIPIARKTQPTQRAQYTSDPFVDGTVLAINV